jgi:citrate synthase
MSLSLQTLIREWRDMGLMTSRTRAYRNDLNGADTDVNLDSICQYEFVMAWMTAVEALSVLNVRAQTLYANVSRGKIRAKPDPTDPRRSLYHRGDVLRMAGRSNGRRKVETVAARTMEWGDPVLPSAISTVVDGRLWYRGHDAVELSAQARFEDVAGLLWECDTILIKAPGAHGHAKTAKNPVDDPLKVALVALAERSVHDLPSHGRAAGVLREEAASVLATLVKAMLGAPALRHERSLSERLAGAWRCPDAEDPLRRALALLADHELNASTFAARVTISTGASLSAGVLAGLTTLTGPLHGGASASVRALVELARNVGSQTAVREWLAQGRALPAFGHPLYPDGDARAATLLKVLQVPPLYAELASCMEVAVGERPNVDFALAVLAEALGLPGHAPLTLFALARCAGWLAHALEQVQTGHLIRPRARYVGPKPAAAS